MQKKKKNSDSALVVSVLFVCLHFSGTILRRAEPACDSLFMSLALRNPKTLAQKRLFQRMSISTYTSRRDYPEISTKVYTTYLFILVVIEQVNAIASPKDAKYQIAKGNVTFNQFILSYPSGKVM